MSTYMLWICRHTCRRMVFQILKGSVFIATLRDRIQLLIYYIKGSANKFFHDKLLAFFPLSLLKTPLINTLYSLQNHIESVHTSLY